MLPVWLLLTAIVLLACILLSRVSGKLDIMVQRQGTVLIPMGHTVLQSGDLLVINQSV